MSLTRSHLVESMLKENFLTKTRSARILETAFEIVKRELEKGEDVLISGFGKFCLKNKASRWGRNPQTGEELILAPRKVVRFQCSPVLKKKLNEGPDKGLPSNRKKP